jgi:hypothetical protein
VDRHRNLAVLIAAWSNFRGQPGYLPNKVVIA